MTLAENLLQEQWLPNPQFDLRLLLERLRRRKHTSQIDDEYTGNLERTILKPLKHVEVTVTRLGSPHSISYDEEICKELLYLSQTNDVDIDSPAANDLTNKARIMAGNNFPADNMRVAILKKGLVPTAFVYPDGTICISQSLMNAARNYDEVLAVIAHEVAHLINETFQRRIIESHNAYFSLSISWTHEIIGDFTAEKLLQRVKANSTAIGTALKGLGEG